VRQRFLFSSPRLSDGQEESQLAKDSAWVSKFAEKIVDLEGISG